MASRPILSPYSVVINGDMSTTIISEVTIIQNCSLISYDISWSGSSCTGTIAVQVSNTYEQNAQGGNYITGNWNTLPLSSVPTISQNTGNGAIDIDATGFYAIRLVYTPSAGTGSMNVTVSGKVA